MSKLLDENSLPSTKSELDLFTVPPTQVAVRRSFWSEVQLQNPCTNAGPYEFRISPDSYMLDLSKNYVRFVVRIVKPDGSNCVANEVDGTFNGDLAVPINLLAKTFFKQVKIYLNGKLISDSGDLYAYRSLVETELNFSDEAKNTQLQAAVYYDDSYSENGMKNSGIKARFQLFKNSSWIEMMAPIHADIFMQDRFMVNQCELRVEMYRNADNFCLMDLSNANTQYKLDIKEMSLFIKKMEINDSLNLAIEQMLKTTTAKYPLRRVQLTNLHITDNRRSTPLNSLFSGSLPRRMVIGLVQSEAVRGTYSSNPFVFKDFGISDIKIVSGTTTVPSTPYKLSFDNNNFMRAYVQMFEGIGIAGDDKGNKINLDRFKNGCAFFVFELGADGSDASHWELVKEGTTSLEINFDKKIPDGGIDCIIYAEFDSMLFLDYSRQAFMDFTV